MDLSLHPSTVNLHLDQWAPTPLTPVSLETDGSHVWAKLEFLNPGGSTKDRIANHILRKALDSGEIQPGGSVVDASSGSTSIAMAMVCAQLGLKFIAVMPAGVSHERTMMIKAYGGEVIFIDSDATMADCISEAKRISVRRGAFFPAQFENNENAEAHRLGTAAEIIRQLNGRRVNAVVAGVGTGGTLVGIYQGMSDHGWPVLPFIAKPVASTGSGHMSDCFKHAESCSAYSKRIPGVIDNMSSILRTFDLNGLQTIEVTDCQALETARELIRIGYPVGPSSGLNYAVAIKTYRLLRDQGMESPVVITVFCDRMERYFSTELFGAEERKPKESSELEM
jgi:cysteine synthase A